jgi:hypothetical protein
MDKISGRSLIAKYIIVLLFPIALSDCIDIKLLTANPDSTSNRPRVADINLQAQRLATILYTITTEDLARNNAALEQKASALVEAFIDGGVKKIFCGNDNISLEHEDAAKLFVKQFAKQMIDCRRGRGPGEIIIGGEDFNCAVKQSCLGGRLLPFCLTF